MNDKPLISIIVPAYNVEKRLPQCLESILGQTYENLELICVNDGSSDSSGIILQKYADQDKRVKIISQSNQGLSGARNAGLNLVDGDYVMFVDGDDWIDLNTCATAVKTARQNDADLVFWSYVREYENASREKRFPWVDGQVFFKNEIREKLWRRICGLTGEELRRPELANAIDTAWGKLYRKNVLEGVAFVDTKEIGTEDALFNLRAFKNINKAVYVDRCFNHYWKANGGSLTSSYNPDLFARWIRMFEMMEIFIGENSLPASFREGLKNRIALSIIGLGLNIDASEMSFFEKSSEIRKILTSEIYKSSASGLPLWRFPLHWAVFFWCAKHNLAGAVLAMIMVMQRFRKG